MESSLDRLIEEVRTKGYSVIADLIARQEAEQFFVDFKLTENPVYTNKKSLFESERKNLAKAISGFANSEGGILVWGVGTSTSGGQTSAAQTITQIKSLKNFRSLIESYIRLSTVPPHTKVENICLEEHPGSDEGVLITIIPKSNDRPHQDLLTNKYYMRAGDSFVPIPHGVLQGMFGKDPLPDVILSYTIANPRMETNDIFLQMGIMIVNKGIGVATDIYGHVRAWPPGENCLFGINISDRENYDFQQAFGVEYSFMSKKDFRLGYQQRTQPLSLRLKFVPPFDKNFEIDILIGAKNQQPKIKTISMSHEKVDEIYQKYISANGSTEFIKEIWEQDNIIQ